MVNDKLDEKITLELESNNSKNRKDDLSSKSAKSKIEFMKELKKIRGNTKK